MTLLDTASTLGGTKYGKKNYVIYNQNNNIIP